MYSVESVDVLGSSMEIFFFQPDGGGVHPGIVLAQHIPVGHTGIENDTFTLRTAERFAANGYAVAVPFIFHWWPKSETIETKRDGSRDDWMAADMLAAHSALVARSDVDNERVGVVGHCWGGRVAWIAACHIPTLSACAVFYGGRIKLTMGAGDIAHIEMADRICCPIIGLFGNDDRNPTPQDVDDYSTALTTAGVPHTFHRYDGAGHAFQNFPTEDRYREVQSEDAWEKVLAFMAEQLGE